MFGMLSWDLKLGDWGCLQKAELLPTLTGVSASPALAHRAAL